MKQIRLLRVEPKIVYLALIYTMLLVILKWSTFSISWSVSEYERRYANSQYVLGNARTEVLGDGDVYTYAGIRYVEGEDVTAINFEHTPLVKYLYGLSYLVTGKPNWILVPLIIISILSFWKLSEVVIYPMWGRYLALVMFLGHSAMYTNMSQTLLDFPMTVFLLLTTLSYVYVEQSRSTLSVIVFGVFSGLFLLSKYPMPLSVLYVLLLLGFLFLRAVSKKHIVVALVSAVVTYLLGYSSYFLHGHSLLDFMRFEWWRWKWFSSKTDNPQGMIWQTLFLGKYPKWWEGPGAYVIIPYWNLLWPIEFLAYLGSWVRLSQLKQLHILFPYQLWVMLALLVYSLGVAEDRFLVPLIPGMALFGASAVVYFAPRVTKMLNHS